MTQDVVVVPREYMFKMSTVNVEKIIIEKQSVSITGNTNFQITAASCVNGITNVTPKYVIPDFTQTLVGILRLADDSSVIELRRIPIEEAKLSIHSYIKTHPGARTSDLIIELALDPDIVIEALSQLRAEQKVEGKDVDTR